MPYCSKCRTYIPDGVDVCPKCGTKDSRYSNVPPKTHINVSEGKKSFAESIKQVLKVEDLTYDFDCDDISSNSNNAVLAYLGPLVVIPFITSRKSKFAMFHCCQGLMNSVFGLLYAILVSLLVDWLPSAIILLFLIPFFLVFTIFPISLILGIVHAIKGKAITLPVFGRINLMRLFFKDL